MLFSSSGNTFLACEKTSGPTSQYMNLFNNQRKLDWQFQERLTPEKVVVTEELPCFCVWQDWWLLDVTKDC